LKVKNWAANSPVQATWVKDRFLIRRHFCKFTREPRIPACIPDQGSHACYGATSPGACRLAERFLIGALENRRSSKAVGMTVSHGEK
jgi:hypothetical protein